MDFQPGQVIRMKSGDTTEFVENVGDDIWLKARFSDEEEALVFGEEIAALVRRCAAHGERQRAQGLRPRRSNFF